ncbi:probable 6-phosphogluconolactonase isoform X1 [Eurosta solidaginis]|uniref:probable 6-phosphogluconolactonase isoform X1 n=1 Tax=Eurosta solidaginis TaxID=178769 RepID=UPI003530C333
MTVIVLADESEVTAKLASEISICAKRALDESGVFRVGLSGGSVLNFLCNAIPRIDTDLSKWKFFFCDERYVVETDPESTYGVYKSKMVPRTNLKLEQFEPIDINLPLNDCASDYEHKILKEFGAKAGTIPIFDLLLLGMGPDGHTCSLFPNHALLDEQTKLIAPIADSPKPPPQRVTMTFPLINCANCCIFAMCGSSKAEMVKRIFVDKEDLPAGRVSPTNGELIIILDKAAGCHIRE